MGSNQDLRQGATTARMRPDAIESDEIHPPPNRCDRRGMGLVSRTANGFSA
jgi:hypothetical protein